MLIKESFCNVENDNEGFPNSRMYSESDWYEPFTSDLGKLYKSLVREYGRCTGKVYIDTPDGSAQGIGWVFVKRVQYDDSSDTYLREVWVSCAHSVVKRVDIDYVTIGGTH